jgi:hypothetical protein
MHSLLINNYARGTENMILAPRKRNEFYASIATGCFSVLT